jgi:nitroimidazol reductase NimA-like FMN-containing flavoprotein (pyridoxamine 5'-phosphate oxidase superfamily)
MPTSPDTRLRRLPERGSQDYDTACAILDAAKICHVGFTLDDQPYVVPMACARVGRQLLLHGSVVSRLMKEAGAGLPICATATHLDGLVLARSAFHSSMNYRSVMVFGQAVAITDEQEKSDGLDALVEHLVPGRLAELRPSTRKELNATSLISLPIEVFTTKSRSAPPDEPKSDIGDPVWAGVVPLNLVAGTPEDAPDLDPAYRPPSYLDLL